MKKLGILGLVALVAFMIGATVYTYYTDQSKNELINGFKITPLGCEKVNEDFTESRFSIANNHDQDFTVWFGEDAIANWISRSTGARGGPRLYSDLAIETVLTLGTVFGLPLRQTEGFVGSLLRMLSLDHLPVQCFRHQVWLTTI